MELEHILTLGMLTLLQAVLGFDNLLYISLESKRAPPEKQAMVRKMGIIIAMVLRLVLLFVLIKLVELFQNPWFELAWSGVAEGVFTLHAVIVLLGGAFILYTATKEILHMMALEEDAHEQREPRSVGSVVFWIVAMNVVFSFDSILSAMALTDVFWVMASAIIIGAGLMIWLADTVSEFLMKNRMYEVLGLFVLFVVGVMLVTEGGHLAHLMLFDSPVHAMTKTTFYFVIGVLVLTDIVQSRYQRKLQRRKQLKAEAEAAALAAQAAQAATG